MPVQRTLVVSDTTTVDEHGTHKTHSKQQLEEMNRTVIRTVIELRIEKFEILAKLAPPGTSLESKPVSSPLMPDTAWVLSVYPKGNPESDTEDKCSFLTKLVTGVGNPTTLDRLIGKAPVYMSLYIANADGNAEINLVKPTTRYFTENGLGQGAHETMEAVEDVLHGDGSLVIVAEVEMLAPPQTNSPCLLVGREKQIGKHIGTSWEPDCSIQVDDGEIITAHRTVLSSCSPSFKEMLDGGEKSNEEGGTGRTFLRLEGYASQSVKAMLEYCYTGSINFAHYGKWEGDVLRLAVNYSLPGMIRHLERHLASSIDTPMRLVQLAQLADMNSCSELEKRCATYITDHFLQVATSSEWEELKTSQAPLAFRLLERVLSAGELPPSPPLWASKKDEAKLSRGIDIKVLTTNSKANEMGVLKTHSKQLAKVSTSCVIIEFRIEQFESKMSFLKPKSLTICSERVETPSFPKITWTLEVYSCGYDVHTSDNASFYIAASGLEEGESIDSLCQIYLLDEAGSKTSVLELTPFRFDDDCSSWGVTRFSQDMVKKKLHKDGSLVVVGEVTLLHRVSPQLFSTSTDAGESEKEMPLLNLPNTPRSEELIKLLLETGMDIDCIIVVGDTSLKAHKAVLSACSASFGAMFAQDNSYKEAREGILRVIDYSPQSVKAMLDFIYTGEIDWTHYGKWEGDVLALADKYGLSELKTHIEGRLVNAIDTPAQMGDLAQLADAHSSLALKKACALHLANHFLEVVASPEWKELKEKRSQLALELLELGVNGGEPLETACG